MKRRRRGDDLPLLVSMDDVAKRVRALLAGLVRASAKGSDAWEGAADSAAATVCDLPTDAVVEALVDDLRSRTPVQRRRQAVSLLTALPITESVEQALERLLGDRDARVRHSVVQAIQRSDLRKLAPALNKLIREDPDVLPRAAAAGVAAHFKDPVNLPALLEASTGTGADISDAALQALARYGHERGIAHVRALMRAPGINLDLKDLSYSQRIDLAHREQTRILAAWILAQHGDEEARSFLVDSLRRLAPHKDLGLATLRATQAICDVNGWPFAWRTDAIKRTLKRLGLVPLDSSSSRRAPPASGRRRR